MESGCGGITFARTRRMFLFMFLFIDPRPVYRIQRRGGVAPYTGPVFDDGGGQGPQIPKFPQNHKGPPLCETGTSDFGGGPWPPWPPLYTGLIDPLHPSVAHVDASFAGVARFLVTHPDFELVCTPAPRPSPARITPARSRTRRPSIFFPSTFLFLQLSTL